MNQHSNKHAVTEDALGRRSRTKRCSTGKRITLQMRDLLWLQKIHEHGPLASSYLHVFSKRICKSEKRALERLTDLFHEENTHHGCAYLSRPMQQFQTLDSRYQQLVYDLAPAGKCALKDARKWSDKASGPSGPWKHRYMVSAITASIELATLGRDDLGFIPQHIILDRANTTLRYPITYINPQTNKQETRDLVPDALFGLEYKTVAGSRFRFFLLEADRSTEPTRTTQFNRKSHLRNFLQYREYVGRGLYKKHLGLKASMVVLNVTTSNRTKLAMTELLSELSPNGNSFQLFKKLEGFGADFKIANPVEDLLGSGWSISDGSGFEISQP